MKIPKKPCADPVLFDARLLEQQKRAGRLANKKDSGSDHLILWDAWLNLQEITELEVKFSSEGVLEGGSAARLDKIWDNIEITPKLGGFSSFSDAEKLKHQKALEFQVIFIYF